LEEAVTRFRRTLFLLAIASLSGSGCAELAIDGSQNKLFDVQVLSRGYDRGGDFCADFNLTSSQVEWFFSHARILDAQRLHDQFDILPCWIRGTAQSSQGKLQWEIRAGGTARRIFDSGSVDLLGCDECDALLPDRNTPPEQ